MFIYSLSLVIDLVDLQKGTIFTCTIMLPVVDSRYRPMYARYHVQRQYVQAAKAQHEARRDCEQTQIVA